MPSLRSIRAMLPCALVGLAIATPTAASAAGCGNVDAVPSAANAAKVRQSTLCLLNRERSQHGLPKLRSQATLARVARRYAGQMVRDGFFDHTSPSGSTMLGRIKASAYLSRARSWSVGENIAWGAGYQASPTAVVESWMDSPGHRRNILDREFREIGIGIVRGAPVSDIGSGGATYVAEFARRGR